MSFYECEKCGGAIGLFCTCKTAQSVSAGLTNDLILEIAKYHESSRANRPLFSFTEGALKAFATALLSAAQRDSQPVAGTSADARDAARYRWLQLESAGDPIWDRLLNEPMTGCEFSATIDAAMKASGEGK